MERRELNIMKQRIDIEIRKAEALEEISKNLQKIIKKMED